MINLQRIVWIVFGLFVVLSKGEMEPMDEHHEAKRILLNDPDIIVSRLNILEREIANLKRDKNDTNKVVKQQASTILALQQQVTQVQNDKLLTDHMVNQQATTIQSLQQQLRDTSRGGSTYTVWGRKSCPSNNDTEEIYSGYAGGGLHSESSSSQEILCMPHTPIFDKTTGEDYGRLYGVEYDSNFYYADANGQDMPCAVCYKKYSTSSMMIPGRNSCFQGWSIEYKGYLSSGSHSLTTGTNHICVADNPEYVDGGESNTNLGALIGPVVTKCGVLKCPPYHNNYPLTCVICSK